MKTLVLFVVVLAGCSTKVVSKATPIGVALPAHNEQVCIMEQSAESYTELGKVVATKKTYGSVDELKLEIANAARKIGANAVVNYTASQKFKGPIPWRAVAPTASGTAVVLKSACLGVYL